MVRLSSLFLGFRWSLYICQNDKELLYAMHGDSVRRLVTYPMLYFIDGSTPVPPWSLHLNFNRKHKSFLIKPEHFYQEGEKMYMSECLLQAIEEIDPKYQVRGSDLVFCDARTKKELKISGYGGLETLTYTDAERAAQFQAMLDNVGKPEEPTFFSVMDMVFGKNTRKNQ